MTKRTKPKKSLLACAQVQPGRSRHRDRVSNGAVLLPGVKKNSAQYRRYKFLYEHWRTRVPDTLEADVLCKQLASAVVRREQLDAQIVNGEDVDPIALTRLCSLITRLTTKLDFLTETKTAQDAPKTFGEMLLENAP